MSLAERHRAGTQCRVATDADASERSGDLTVRRLCGRNQRRGSGRIVGHPDIDPRFADYSCLVDLRLQKFVNAAPLQRTNPPYRTGTETPTSA
jgi:hypothetical protein